MMTVIVKTASERTALTASRMSRTMSVQRSARNCTHSGSSFGNWKGSRPVASRKAPAIESS